MSSESSVRACTTAWSATLQQEMYGGNSSRSQSLVCVLLLVAEAAAGVGACGKTEYMMPALALHLLALSTEPCVLV